MKPGKRVTMADVARCAGVTQPTVSMALRQDPRISKATQQRVLEAAEALGYRRNPLVSALMAQMHGRRRGDESPVIALITGWPREQNEWETLEIFHEIRAGMEARAQDMGYRVEEHFLEDYPRAGRLSQVLEQRGVRGLILSPMRGRRLEGFDWRSFSAVCLGDSLASPRLSRVAPSQFFNARLALERLTAMGSKRIGLVLLKRVDEGVNGAWSGAYLAQRQWLPKQRRLPICFVDTWEDQAVVKEYLERYQPDAVLHHDVSMFSSEQRQSHLLVELGLFPSQRGDHFGIDPNRMETGATLVDVVVAQLHRNEFGVPERPKTVLIEGRWHVPTAPVPIRS